MSMAMKSWVPFGQKWRFLRLFWKTRYFCTMCQVPLYQATTGTGFTFFTHCVSLPQESTGPQDSRYRLQFAILSTRIPENWKRTSRCRCTTQQSCPAVTKATPLSRTQLNFPHCCCNSQVVAGCRSQVVPGCTAAPRRAGRPPGTRQPPGTPRATPPPCRSPAAPGPTRRAARWTGRWGWGWWSFPPTSLQNSLLRDFSSSKWRRPGPASYRPLNTWQNILNDVSHSANKPRSRFLEVRLNLYFVWSP